MAQWREQSGIHQFKLDPQGTPIALHVPTSAQAGHPLRLIVALHWGGPMYPNKGRDFLQSLVAPGLEPLHALIAAPDCPAESWTDPQSESLILTLVERLQEQGTIDPQRVALMGYSMGGIGTWHIAARNQHRFAAALILSARPIAGALSLGWRIPLYVIHGRQDEIFPFAEVQAAVDELRRRGAAVQFEPLEGVTHFETQRFIEPLRRAAAWLGALWDAAG